MAGCPGGNHVIKRKAWKQVHAGRFYRVRVAFQICGRRTGGSSNGAKPLGHS